MNAYAGALITNRTFVWTFCIRKPCLTDDEETCSLYLHRHEWIPHLKLVQEKWKAEGCDGKSSSSGVPEHKQVITFRHRYAAEKILACCGVEKIKAVFLDFGGMDRREMFAMSLPSADLSPTAKKIAHVIFERGEDYGYGLMFRSLFHFTPLIKQQNRGILLEMYKRLSTKVTDTSESSEILHSKDIYQIGIHIRHSNNRDIGNGTNAESLETKCIRTILAQHDMDGKKCVLMVASDRANTLERMQEQAKILSCEFVTSNHTKVRNSYGEHGPFHGEIAMADIDLLSNSDYFIGSSYSNMGYMPSTYSMLISALVPTQDSLLYPSSPLLPSTPSLSSSGKDSVDYKKLYETAVSELNALEEAGKNLHQFRKRRRRLHDTSPLSKIPVKWLPTCGIALGARYQPDPIYANEGNDFKCSDFPSLPETCPSHPQ